MRILCEFCVKDVCFFLFALCFSLRIFSFSISSAPCFCLDFLVFPRISPKMQNSHIFHTSFTRLTIHLSPVFPASFAPPSWKHSLRTAAQKVRIAWRGCKSAGERVVPHDSNLHSNQRSTGRSMAPRRHGASLSHFLGLLQDTTRAPVFPSPMIHFPRAGCPINELRSRQKRKVVRKTATNTTPKKKKNRRKKAIFQIIFHREFTKYELPDPARNNYYRSSSQR